MGPSDGGQLLFEVQQALEDRKIKAVFRKEHGIGLFGHRLHRLARIEDVAENPSVLPLHILLTKTFQLSKNRLTGQACF